MVRVDSGMEPPPPPAQPADLSAGARVACGLVALAGFAAGGAATFLTENELGASTMLVIGVLGGVIALLGRVPRIKLGDNEIDPTSYRVGAVAGAVAGAESVAEVVDKAAVAGRVPPELVEAARRIVDERAEDWAEIASRMARRSAAKWRPSEPSPPGDGADDHRQGSG